MQRKPFAARFIKYKEKRKGKTMAEENRKKETNIVCFSVRIPEYQHRWLKARSKSTKGIEFESMNKIIREAIDEYMGIN